MPSHDPGRASILANCGGLRRLGRSLALPNMVDGTAVLVAAAPPIQKLAASRLASTRK
jgi:hypothetical protein